jgi:hypothetical protein
MQGGSIAGCVTGAVMLTMVHTPAKRLRNAPEANRCLAAQWSAGMLGSFSRVLVQENRAKRAMDQTSSGKGRIVRARLGT